MSNQKDEIKSRDEDAEDYEEWYLRSKGYYYDWVEKKIILDTLGLQKEDTVLDAGCGTGRFTREIAKKCKKVYGIDFSATSIEVLSRKAQEEGIKNIETFVGDITKPLPIKEKVDKIVSVQVIQHIPTDTERCLALKNLHTQLKPGGACVVSLYNWSFILCRQLAKVGKFPGGIHYSMFTSDEARTLLKECGFENVSIRGCINFRLYNVISGRRFNSA